MTRHQHQPVRRCFALLPKLIMRPRYIKLLVRKQFLKYLLSSMLLWIHMKEIILTFNQPSSYLRARGARAEIGDFVEYDLDNEDKEWLEDFNKERMILPAEKFETILFKLEVLDHKAWERAGVITPTLGSPIPVLLTFDAAVQVGTNLTCLHFSVIYYLWL